MEEKKVIAHCVPAMVLSLLVTAFSANQIIINDITCHETITLMEPCKQYLEGKGPLAPSYQCCDAATTVFLKANSTQSELDVCECLKGAEKKMHVDPTRASELPKYCKINLLIPPSPDANCSNL